MNLRRIGGCSIVKGIIGLLFDETIIPIRLVNCEHKLGKKCSFDNCERYRIGTVGHTKVSWDCPGARA